MYSDKLFNHLFKKWIIYDNIVDSLETLLLVCFYLDTLSTWCWVIVVRSDNTRSSLLQDGYLLMDECRIALYGDNPFLGANREDTENVLIKDLPVWASDGLIKDYIKTQSQLNPMALYIDPRLRTTSASSASSPFFTGDRYFYAQRVIDPPLPDKIKFRDHTCRIMYVVCERCHMNNHKSTDLGKCDEYIASQLDLLAFTRGTFSNFDRCHNGWSHISNMRTLLPMECFH